MTLFLKSNLSIDGFWYLTVQEAVLCGTRAHLYLAEDMVRLQCGDLGKQLSILLAADLSPASNFTPDWVWGALFQVECSSLHAKNLIANDEELWEQPSFYLEFEAVCTELGGALPGM